jgi:phosphatidylinositol alpha-mannosyltransferase
MRTCLVVPYDLTVEGGVKKHALCLAEALRRQGDDVELIGPASGPVDLPQTVAFGGIVSIRSNGSDNRLGLLTSPRQVRAYLKSRDFDILHVHEPLTPALPYYALWWARAKARIATFHCFAEHESFGRRMLRKLASPLLGRIDRGIAVSPAAARYAEWSWRRRLAIIPNGVDTRFFKPPASQPPTAKDRPMRLLFVGQWTDERKGLPVLLEAYSQMRRRGINVSLDIVGRGDPTLTWPPWADGITSHGHVSEPELRHRLHACDVFVSPAIGSESFGMVLLEAMAAGKPVVCSDIEGYRQVATGPGSIRVPPRDAAALATVLTGLVADPTRCRTMGQENLDEVGCYDWGQVAARVRSEYLEALAERAARSIRPLDPRKRIVEENPAADADADADAA